MWNFRHKTCSQQQAGCHDDVRFFFFVFRLHDYWVEIRSFLCEMSTRKSNHVKIIADTAHAMLWNNENIWIPFFNHENDFNSTAL